MSNSGQAGTPGTSDTRRTDCRVLVIDDHQYAVDNFRKWSVEAGRDRDPPVDVRVVQCEGADVGEMKEWFRRRFPKGRGMEPGDRFDIVILDIMFQAKDGEKQTRGGCELWEHLMGEGIDEQFQQLLVVSRGELPAEFKNWRGGKVWWMANKERDRFLELFEEMLVVLR